MVYKINGKFRRHEGEDGIYWERPALSLIFPGKLPNTNDINNAGRGNKYAAWKQKRDVQDELCLEWAGVKQIYGDPPMFPDKVNIRIKFYEKNGRRDEDNVMGGMKFILDALQELGVIKNDSPKYCHVLPECFVRKDDPCVVVEIWERKNEK